MLIPNSDKITFFNGERECSCFDNTFICIESTCALQCPETKPTDGDSCTEFIDDSCEYRLFCCTGDETNCVPDSICTCFDFSGIRIDCSPLLSAGARVAVLQNYQNQEMLAIWIIISIATTLMYVARVMCSARIFFVFVLRTEILFVNVLKALLLLGLQFKCQL